MNGSLFLSPEQPQTDFSDIDALKKCLHELGLMSIRSTGRDTDSYLCGESFAQMITFMGCSPHLVFEPPADGSDQYCHIRLHHFSEITLLTGQQTAPPRCPACRFRISDWRNMADDWRSETPTSSWQCPNCKKKSAAYELDWRQSGGAGRVFIEIRNIFPGEAVPVDQLMAKLEEISGEKWRYFYLV